MAEQLWNFQTLCAASGSIKDKIDFITNQINKTQEAATVGGEAVEAADSINTLQGLLLTTLNGDYGLPEQTVVVEYLNEDQKLVIPAALGMSGYAQIQTLTPVDETLAARYRKVATSSLAVLRNIVAGATSRAAIRAAIDNMADVPMPNVNWFSEATYAEDLQPGFSKGERNVFYGALSGALAFNCDIRDYGMLCSETMRMADNFDGKTAPLSRLMLKLMPHTLQSIAALNYGPVGNVGIAAWVRAVGLAVGMLPNATSVSVVEYKFTKAHPSVDHRAAVVATEVSYGEQLLTMSMNIIAMFGLMHLNKDHTYLTNDPVMARIGKSYINTLRTIVPDSLMQQLHGATEAIVRTAAHPFGLGQTYAVAQLLAANQRLAPALMLRRNVAPPPVQRFFLVRAAMAEWGALPVGQAINAHYETEQYQIESICAAIEANPTQYSALYKNYGHTTQSIVGPQPIASAKVMLPLVVGYAESQHGDGEKDKDGMALAQSIANIRRENNALCSTYKNLWDKYLEGIENSGLLEMARQTQDILRGGGTTPE